MATPERIQTDRARFFLWGRRIAAALIAAVFLPVVILAITFSGMRSTVAEPDDLIQALTEADLYGYTHDHLIPSTLDRIVNETDHELIHVAAPWKGDVAASLRAAFPPGEMRVETENALRTVWPYVRGEKDSFEILIPVAPRAARGFDELSRRVSRENPDVYEPLIELLEGRANEEAAVYSVSSVNLNDITSTHVREIAPSDWLFPRLGQAVDDTGAYVIGETENPVITVPIDDRAEAVRSAMVDILTEADIDDAALREAIVAAVDAQTRTDALSLPGLGAVDAAEVTDIILEEISRDELNRAKTDIAHEVSAYAVGLSEEPLRSEVTLSLARARIDSSNRIAAEADRRLEAEFNAVPICQAGQDMPVRMPGAPDDILPPCVIQGITYADYKQAFGLDVERITRDAVQRIIPVSVSIDSDDVRNALDDGETDLIERIRETVTEGVTADTGNLFAELSNEIYGDPDRLREGIRSGIRISEETLADESLDAARDFVRAGGIIQIVLWLLAATLLILTALIGGRGWEGRLTWASIVLAAGAILTWLLAAVPLDLIVRPALEEWSNSLITEFTDDAAIELVARVDTLIDSLVSVISGRIQSQAIRVGVIAGVALIIARLIAPDAVGRRPSGR